MHFFRCTDFADRAVYPTVEGFFADLGRIFRDEIADLAKAGCRYIQFDEVALAQLCDPAIRKMVEDAGQKPDHLVDLYIESHQRRGRRGAARCAWSPSTSAGATSRATISPPAGYEAVAEQFFGRTRVNHFLLEYDTQRAGDF